MIDPHARYFGVELDDHSLVPGDAPNTWRDPLHQLARAREAPATNRTLLSLAALARRSPSLPPWSRPLRRERQDHPGLRPPLPNVPGKSLRGILVEYGPGGSSPARITPVSAFIYATVLEGEIMSARSTAAR